MADPDRKSKKTSAGEVLGYLFVAVSAGLFLLIVPRLVMQDSGKKRSAPRPAAARREASARETAAPRRLQAKGAMDVPSPVASAPAAAKASPPVREAEPEAAPEPAPPAEANAAYAMTQSGFGSYGSAGGSTSLDTGAADSSRPSARGGGKAAVEAKPKMARGGTSSYAGPGGAGGRYAAAKAPPARKNGETPKKKPPAKAAIGEGAAFYDGGGEAERGGVLKAVRSVQVGGLAGSAAGGEISDPVFQRVFTQMDKERKIVDHLRDKIEEQESAGQPVERAEVMAAAQAYIADNDVDAESVDPEALVERAMSPVPPADPVQLGEHARLIIKRFKPPTPEEKKEILQQVEKPPPKYDPPPKSAIQTYERYPDAFRWAKENLGVEPHHILGILGVETRYGNYTGKHGVLKVLHTVSEKGGRQGKQADKDIPALLRMSNNGELGGFEADTVRGSYAGALGIGQFLPSSWEAYALDRDGGKRNPFSHEDAIISVANYLKKHGYSKDVKKSFWGYNHSTEYVNKVNDLAEQIKPGLKK
ncbi:MAG: lytic murein transglycosylase [Elusimicrobiota bacterium]